MSKRAARCTKDEADDKVIAENRRNRRGAPVEITPDGEIQCKNKRVEWLAQARAKGGTHYNPDLECWEVDRDHRLEGRPYVSLFAKIFGRK